MNIEAIKELCIITTRDTAGQHFTETSDHWEELEAAGFIQIDRPIHEATGIPYDEQYWSLEVTAEGQAEVAANEDLWPD